MVVSWVIDTPVKGCISFSATMNVVVLLRCLLGLIVEHCSGLRSFAFSSSSVNRNHFRLRNHFTYVFFLLHNRAAFSCFTIEFRLCSRSTALLVFVPATWRPFVSIAWTDYWLLLPFSSRSLVCFVGCSSQSQLIISHRCKVTLTIFWMVWMEYMCRLFLSCSSLLIVTRLVPVLMDVRYISKILQFPMLFPSRINAHLYCAIYVVFRQMCRLCNWVRRNLYHSLSVCISLWLWTLSSRHCGVGFICPQQIR